MSKSISKLSTLICSIINRSKEGLMYMRYIKRRNKYQIIPFIMQGRRTIRQRQSFREWYRWTNNDIFRAHNLEWLPTFIVEKKWKEERKSINKYYLIIEQNYCAEFTVQNVIIISSQTCCKYLPWERLRKANFWERPFIFNSKEKIGNYILVIDG